VPDTETIDEALVREKQLDRWVALNALEGLLVRFTETFPELKLLDDDEIAEVRLVGRCALSEELWGWEEQLPPTGVPEDSPEFYEWSHARARSDALVGGMAARLATAEARETLLELATFEANLVSADIGVLSGQRREI